MYESNGLSVDHEHWMITTLIFRGTDLPFGRGKNVHFNLFAHKNTDHSLHLGTLSFNYNPQNGLKISTRPTQTRVPICRDWKLRRRVGGEWEAEFEWDGEGLEVNCARATGLVTTDNQFACPIPTVPLCRSRRINGTSSAIGVRGFI